ncbi:OmpA family protein [Oceaniglobus indicus]|uniref:OmpA family protein n=1 Tax=Oceaniglobus indicus TaxID=2047749 RepID=UPI000C195C49|nr:OmpA family protein [Oceaniglobus indicus]
MRTSLRTTTALLAGLSLVTPTILPAQNAANKEAIEACAADPQNCDPKALAEGLMDGLAGQDAQAEAAEDSKAEPAEMEAEQEPAEAEQQSAEADAEQQPAEAEAAAETKVEAEEAPEASAAAESDLAPAEVEQKPRKKPKQAESAEQKADKKQNAKGEKQADKKQDAKGEMKANKADAADKAQNAEAEARKAAEDAKSDAMEAARKATEGAKEATENAGTAADAATDPAGDDNAKTMKAQKKAEREARKAANAKKEADSAAEQAADGSGEKNDPLADLAATAAAALGATMDTNEGEVEEETVTEETARSSDEDFEGQINAEATAPKKDKDGFAGLSKFEKALAVGVGALGVGAIIRGNREVISTSPDRVVVSSSDGQYQVIKDDDALLRQPGNQVQTRTFDDGSTRSVVTREDGSQVITVRDPELRVVRRALVRTDGTEVMLIDDTQAAEPVDVSKLPEPAKTVSAGNDDALRAALEREGVFDRRFTLAQVRQIKQVRDLAPSIAVESIRFETGSAAIRPEEAEKLADLGLQIREAIERNPNEIFLVEGHTDAVGSAATNLILSDRRAESLALALTEYFDVPPENLVVQGYGESDLKVETDTAEAANRRAELRRITPLLQVASR